MLNAGASNGINRVEKPFRWNSYGGSRNPGTPIAWNLTGGARLQKRLLYCGPNWDLLLLSGIWIPDLLRAKYV